MSLKEFIFSRLFLKHLGLAVAIAAGMIMLLLLWLNIYTRHGQARPVPDFTGLTVHQADSLAKKKKMKYQIIDSVYTTLVPRGCIAEQSIKPGFKVKKWRNILLTLNAFRPEMVKMPNLIDLPQRQAIALIEGSGLVMGKKTYKSDLSIGFVLSQLNDGKEIAPNDSIQKGSVIDLVLGKGLSNQKTSVPNLIGMGLNPAKERLNSSSLNLGTCIFDNTIHTGEDSLKAFVYQQSPVFEENATIPYGYSMYLWLTVDSLRLPADSTRFATPDTIAAPVVKFP